MSLPLNLTAKQITFLRCYEQCFSVTQSARWTKITRRTHYDWLDESEAYRIAFAQSERVAAKVLEDEAVRRAHAGCRREVRYKGKVVGYELEYSDMLLALLLKGNLPDKYKDRTDIKHTGEIGVKRVMGVPDEEI